MNNPEIYNSTAEVLVFRFCDGAGYIKFAEYAHEQESHTFVCDNRNFTVTTDAFTREEALRMAKVVPGLSAIFAVSFKRGESVKLMKFDKDGFLQEPCLSCTKAYIENIWHDLLGYLFRQKKLVSKL